MMQAVRQIRTHDATGTACDGDLRVLVLGAVLLVVLIISSNRLWFPLICLAGVLAGGMAAGARLRQLVPRLSNPLLIACLLLLFKTVA